jgi:hypothetical protein
MIDESFERYSSPAYSRIEDKTIDITSSFNYLHVAFNE